MKEMVTCKRSGGPQTQLARFQAQLREFISHSVTFLKSIEDMFTIEHQRFVDSVHQLLFLSDVSFSFFKFLIYIFRLQHIT